MKQIAFLIGINQYQNIGSVNYAEKDAEDFSQELQKYCGFCKGDIFLLQTDSRGNILGFRLALSSTR